MFLLLEINHLSIIPIKLIYKLLLLIIHYFSLGSEEINFHCHDYHCVKMSKNKPELADVKASSSSSKSPIRSKSKEEIEDEIEESEPKDTEPISLEDQVLFLQQQLQQLQKQLSGKVSSPSVSSQACRKPNPFDGDPEQLEFFISRLEIYLEAKQVPSELKLSTAVTYLEDSAIFWYRKWVKTLDEEPSFELFIDNLRENFKDLNTSQKARNDLYYLRQKGNLGDYI